MEDRPVAAVVEGRRRPRRWGGAGDGGEAPARGTAAVRRGCAGVCGLCVCVCARFEGETAKC